jgi:hypothetical protein
MPAPSVSIFTLSPIIRGNFLRMLATLEPVKQWPLTSLKEKLIKTGAPVQGVAREVGLLDNLRTIAAGIRKSGIQTFIVPHHRWESGDYQTWDHPNPYQLQLVRQRQLGR